MVLAAKGYVVSESELRERCDCTFLGTEALNAVTALRAMGFIDSCKCTLRFAELVVELNAGLYPVVFVNLLPVDGVNEPHAVVVISADEDEVQICDPLKGERLLPRSTFDTAWAMMRNLTILVRD
jgi:ABC-type bacteriocin/lantibiotic exporter with double-glycine peptidase domain